MNLQRKFTEVKNDVQHSFKIGAEERVKCSEKMAELYFSKQAPTYRNLSGEDRDQYRPSALVASSAPQVIELP